MSHFTSYTWYLVRPPSAPSLKVWNTNVRLYTSYLFRLPSLISTISEIVGWTIVLWKWSFVMSPWVSPFNRLSTLKGVPRGRWTRFLRLEVHLLRPPNVTVTWNTSSADRVFRDFQISAIQGVRYKKVSRIDWRTRTAFYANFLSGRWEIQVGDIFRFKQDFNVIENFHNQ